MDTENRVWLNEPGDAKRIHPRMGGNEHDIPILQIGPALDVWVRPQLDPTVQIELLCALRNHVDTLIEMVHERAAKIRHAGDWGGDAA